MESLVALLVTAVGAAWAGLLVLAEEAPAVPLADAPRYDVTRRWPLGRALAVARFTTISIAGIAAASAVQWWTRSPAEALARVGVATVTVFVLSDAIPRALGTLSPALATAALRWARRTLSPFRPLLGFLGAVEQKLRRGFPEVGDSSHMGREERDTLAGVMSLQQETVAEVMTPRLDIVALDINTGWKEMVELLRRSEHSRLPVYDGDVDAIVGVLCAKDVTPHVAGVHAPPQRWQTLVRTPQYVPESKPLAHQLRDFQRGAGHLAIVVDEFGGTSGLITLEDILEEVVGEIRGEYDADEEPPISQEGEDKFWVDGAVTLDTLSSWLGSPFEREEITTVGGLIYSELGRVPRPGEELRVGQFRIVVEKVVHRRIRRVYFERIDQRFLIEAGPEGDT